MTAPTSYREERRLDKAAEREADREDKRLQLEAHLALQEQRAEQARKDGEAKRRAEAADKREADKRRDKKRAERAEKLGDAVAWVKGHTVEIFVGAVMTAAIVPAVISQVGALVAAGVPVLMAALLAGMVEGGAWALTFMGARAEKREQPTGKFRVGTWVAAAVAAAVNFWHWSTQAPVWVAIVFAVSSLFAVFLWDTNVHGSHGSTKAERREARDRRRHARARRKHHKSVAKAADRILSAVDHGSLTESDAWAAAWRIEYGTEPGMTPALYARATKAGAALGEAFQAAEDARPETLRAGLLAGLHSPLPHRSPGGRLVGLPTLDESLTTQFPLGIDASDEAADPAPERALATVPGTGPAKAPERPSQDWIRHLPQALEVADDLVAEGRQISASALAKALRIRRADCIPLREAVIAERKRRQRDAA